MTYELAKELKEAGFQPPLKAGGNEGHALVLYPKLAEQDEDDRPMARIPWGQFVTLRIDGNPEVVYEPTLEELIAACGEAFDGLWLPPEGMDGKTVWIASPKWDWRKMVKNSDHRVVAPTPTEAVAMLYLALHPKR